MVKTKEEKPEKPPRKKLTPQQKKKLYWVGGGGFFLLIILMAMVPSKGSVYYGICKTYVELAEIYPQEFKPLSVEDYVAIGGPVKMFYRKVDPFGVISVNTVDCTFKKDANGNPLYALAKVDINGKYKAYEAEKPEVIERFNKGISGILAGDPDLTLPSFSINNISGYKDAE